MSIIIVHEYSSQSDRHIIEIWLIRVWEQVWAQPVITGLCTSLNGGLNLYRETTYSRNDTVWTPSCFIGLVYFSLSSFCVQKQRSQDLLTLSVHLSQPMTLYFASERLHAIMRPLLFQTVQWHCLLFMNSQSKGTLQRAHMRNALRMTFLCVAIALLATVWALSLSPLMVSHYG